MHIVQKHIIIKPFLGIRSEYNIHNMHIIQLVMKIIYFITYFLLSSTKLLIIFDCTTLKLIVN